MLPNYVGYANTAAASLWPMNADVFDIARKQGAHHGLRASVRHAPRPVQPERGDPLRDADRCGARQARLLRGDGVQRSPDHVGVLVPAAQLRLQDSRGGGHGRVPEFRVAPRAAGAGAGVRADRRTARASSVAGRHPTRTHVCHEFSDPRPRLEGRRKDRRTESRAVARHWGFSPTRDPRVPGSACDAQVQHAPRPPGAHWKRPSRRVDSADRGSDQGGHFASHSGREERLVRRAGIR